MVKCETCNGTKFSVDVEDKFINRELVECIVIVCDYCHREMEITHDGEVLI